MSSCQNKAEPIQNLTGPIQNLKRTAKICAVAWTIIYVLLLPLLSYGALMLATISLSFHLSVPKGLFTVFTTALLPLSLPVSVDLMWSSYMCEEYGSTLFSWSVPWMTLIAVMVVHLIMQFS